MYIYKAAVIGAGTMGAGIAQVITYSGLPVVLKDVNQELVDKGLATIKKIYQGRVEKGKMTESDMQAKLDLVIPTTSNEALKDVDIVIEAATEDMGIKKKIFQELDQVCQESTILASNTSALSITEMAAATKRSHKVVGMHFFFPAHIMKLVEVIPGLETSDETVEDIVSFTESLRKIPVKVKECAGFLVNRILGAMLGEAMRCLDEGVASMKDIDMAMVAGAGMPMGPFTLSDNLGLDILDHVAKTLYRAYGERFLPSPTLDKYVKAGRLGMKSGKGFYEYTGE